VNSTDNFEFTESSKRRCEEIISRYPDGRKQSAVIPVLDLAQRQCGGWLPNSAIEHIADYLNMPKIRVLEVASFYSMFNLKPVGKYFIQLCRTTPCWLRGADDLRNIAIETTGCKLGETSEDGLFTLTEVECLGACCNAPMVQINDDYYEDLTSKSFKNIIESLKQHNSPSSGSQLGRTGSEPASGLTSLTEKGISDVS
tara:strand:- start:1077 stop:1673 length:597 start_codon:yes stop_codon:yes gene_type:complete